MRRAPPVPRVRRGGASCRCVDVCGQGPTRRAPGGGHMMTRARWRGRGARALLGEPWRDAGAWPDCTMWAAWRLEVAARGATRVVAAMPDRAAKRPILGLRSDPREQRPMGPGTGDGAGVQMSDAAGSPRPGILAPLPASARTARRLVREGLASAGDVAAVAESLVSELATTVIGRSERSAPWRSIDRARAGARQSLLPR